MQSVLDFFYRLLLTLFDFLKDFVYWLSDILMQAVIVFLDSLSLSLNAISPLTYIDAIPEEVKWYMVACGFNESIGMIVAAITIRLLMRFIPFF